eukprot:11356191-Karenia_brevis.AAC.1
MLGSQFRNVVRSQGLSFWSLRGHSLQLLQGPTLKPSCKTSMWLRGAKPSCEIGTSAVGPDVKAPSRGICPRSSPCDDDDLYIEI